MVPFPRSPALPSVRLLLLSVLVAGALACTPRPEPPPPPAPPPSPPPPATTIETQTVEISCDCARSTCTVDRPLAVFEKKPERPGQRLKVVWKASAGHPAGEFEIVYSGGANQEKNLVFPENPPPPIRFAAGEDGVGFVSNRWWSKADGPNALELRWDYKVQFRATGGPSCEIDPQICVPGLNQGGSSGGEPCR